MVKPTMPTGPRGESARGRGWVVVQFTLMAAALVSGPVWRAHWSGWWTWAAGGLFLVAGAWAGVRGERELGNNRTAYPRPKDNGQLITTGIYSLMRHPLYVAVILLGFSWALLWRSWPALILAVIQVFYFDAKARREERWLRDRFAGYNDYARRVSRFVPRIY